MLRQQRRPGVPAQFRRRRVNEEPFTVALGGRSWALPHLPFRAIKKIQPLLFQLYGELGGAEASLQSLARFTEAQLDRLAEAAYVAVAVVDKELSREAFFELPFSVGELIDRKSTRLNSSHVKI